MGLEFTVPRNSILEGFLQLFYVEISSFSYIYVNVLFFIFFFISCSITVSKISLKRNMEPFFSIK